MKCNDNLDKYIRGRLEEWAQWFSNDNEHLGFSNRNIIARLKDQGGIVNDTVYSEISVVNVEAEEIERLYLHLFKKNEKQAEALRIHYHFAYDHESKALQSGFSKTQYYQYLKMAHEWLRGFFSARKKI